MGLCNSSDRERHYPLRHRIRKWVRAASARLTTVAQHPSTDSEDRRLALAWIGAYSAVLIIAAAGIAVSNLDWSAPAASVPTDPTSSHALQAEGRFGDEGSATEPGVPDQGASSTADGTVDGFLPQAQTYRATPERRRPEIAFYSVQAGDTVPSIADQFGLDPTTILWANPSVEDAPDLLRIGQSIIILPIDGVYHKVEDGDTLASIAEKYGVQADAIVSYLYNDLENTSQPIVPGQYLIVPAGHKPYEPKTVNTSAGAVPQGVRGTGRFQWPTIRRITQGYWYGHRAIDLGAPTGTAVVASDGGFISFAGWTDVGYGYLIVVDHANGFVTYYAHLSTIYVTVGQAVERGKVIGAVGSTGNSTGPHLHFEVRHHAVQHNPMAYLP